MKGRGPGPGAGDLAGRIRSFLRRFAGERRGNVALITAGMVVMTIFALGIGVDYTFARQRQDQLQGIADAAALSATTPASMLQTAANAQVTATTMWNGQVANVAGAGSPTAVITVTDSKPGQAGNVRTVTVSYTATSSTVFSGVIGMSTLPIQGSSSATMGSTPYINIYVLLDNSQSMGIASTTADMTKLYNVTSSSNYDGCVFGCHVALDGEQYSDEALAHANGVTLRIDSAKTAISTMINLASTNNMSARVQFAIYTMGAGDSSGANLLKQVSGLSNNYSGLLSSVTNIDLEPGAQGVIGDTDIEDAMTALQAKLPSTNGSGATQANALNFVFIVTDGLDDFDTYNYNLPCLNNGPLPGGYRCTQALNDSVCTSMKVSANIGVIYTPYLPLYNYNNSSYGYYVSYQDLVAQYASTIPANLQACATNSSLYISASDGPTLVSAMMTLFGRAMNSPYLKS